MTDRDLYRETFSHLHASGDTVTEVLNMANHPANHKRPGRRALTALIAAACVLALSVTAYAIGEHTGFFEQVFGDTGVESRDAYETVADDTKPDSGMVTVPAYERVPVDPEAAEDLIGAQVTDVNKSFTLDGVTFTAESMVIDENGIGALTYTVSNPDGFPDMSGAYGETFPALMEMDEEVGYYGDGGVPMVTVYNDDGEERYLFPHTYLDSASSTDTQIRLTAYFWDHWDVEPGDELRLTLRKFTYNYDEPLEIIGDDGQPEGTEPSIDETEEHLTFTVEDPVPAVTFTAEDGHTASVSPMGVVLDDWYDALHGLRLDYADGTEYVVRGDDVDNTQFGALCNPGSFGVYGKEIEEDTDGDGEIDTISYGDPDPALCEGMWRTMEAFNRLVEPENVTAVHTTGGADSHGNSHPDRTFTR